VTQPDFRSFTTKAKSGRLRSLVNDCQVCAAFNPTVTPQPQLPQYEKFRAIWDTGATNSVISQQVVDSCALKPTGMTQVHGVHGTANSKTFLVNIILPNAVQFANVEVTLGNVTGADLLIGMDIITTGDFAITNVKGNTTFSFRFPSIATIDYVKEADAVSLKAKRQAKRKKRPGKKRRPWS